VLGVFGVLLQFLGFVGFHGEPLVREFLC